MIALLLAQAALVSGGAVRPVDPDVAAAKTPVEAERAFADKAAREGTWTAFRAFADDDATLFVPQPINALTYLKSLKDPARPIRWWPTASWASCDGSYAVNTGGWQTPGGGTGFFSTVWRRQPDAVGGWRWTVDGGGKLTAARPRPAEPAVRRAACTGEPPAIAVEHSREGLTSATAGSLDRTLRWRWLVDAKGARTFEAWLWNGRALERVVADRIPAGA